MITSVAARHSIGQRIDSVEVVRQPANNAYFGDISPVGSTIVRVYRRGKHVLFELDGGRWIDCHNAMTGYWDYEDDPWSFDYVEGPRDAGSHVRVRMSLSNGRVLRFNDARFFGRLRVVSSADLPRPGPELLQTTWGGAGAPVITLEQFADRVSRDRHPIKVLLLDQGFVAGIGNIYANEGCHLAGIDPRTPGCDLGDDRIPLLLEALRCVVLHCIPTVTYQWLKVYRRPRCGSCGSVVVRVKLAGRSTFTCETCQS